MYMNGLKEDLEKMYCKGREWFLNLKLILIVCLLLIINILTSSFCMQTACAETSIGTALKTVCESLNYKNGYYWGYKGTKQVNPGPKETYDFTAVNTKVNCATSGWSSGTSGYYGYTYYTGSNNSGGAWTECAGFALYLGYKITGQNPLSSSKWTRYTSLDSAGDLQVGDIVAIKYKKSNGSTSTHMAVVYSSSGGKYTFIQAGGGSNNAIRVNKPFYVAATDAAGNNVSALANTVRVGNKGPTRVGN